MPRASENPLPALVMVVGLPASGKSTLARKLAAKFKTPMLEKDDLKEALYDTVGFQNYPEKRRLDVAANAVLLRAAGELLDAKVPVVIVNNFRKDMEDGVKKFIASHPCRPVTVFLEGDADEFYRRYVARDAAHARHIAHALQDHYPLREGESADFALPTREDFARMFESLGMADVDLGCARINVDATDPSGIDADAVAEAIVGKIGKID